MLAFTGMFAQVCPGGLGTTVNIASLPFTGTGFTTCGAGNELTSANVTTCGSTSYFGGEDLVFVFTPTSSGLTTINLTSTSSWIGMMLYAGCPFSGQGGTCVANVQSSTGSKSLTATVNSGTTYYLVVDTWPTPNCIPSFDLSITAPAGPPACNTLVGPITTISSLPYSATGLTTCGAGNDVTSANAVTCGSSSYLGGEDQVFEFTPTTSGTHTIALTSSSSWVGLTLYAGCPATAGGGTCVGSAQSSAGNQTLTISLTAGTTYYLVVDTWPSPTCIPSYNLSITSCPSPVGNTLASPIVVPSFPYTNSNNNLPANCWTSNYTGTNAQSSPDVFYQFTVTGCENRVNLSLCGTGFDTYMHLLNSSGAWIASNDDNGPLCTGTASSLQQVLAPGTYYVVVEGFGANTGNFTLNLTSNDLTAPAIVNCPPTQTALVNAQCQGTLGDYRVGVNTTDNCPGAVTLTQTPAPGTTFTGVTNVTLRATDAAGNSSTCNVLITIIDVTAPVITCPANVTVAANTSCTASLASYTGSTTAVDNCGSATITQTPAAGTSLTLNSVNTITMRATDGVGNSSTCTFTVRVSDLTGPTISCPTNIVQSNATNQCGATVNYASAAASELCSPPASLTNLGQPSGTFFPVGSSSVTFRASDAAGNTSTCSFTITINDTQLPTISCPASITKTNDLDKCGSVTVFPNATASDNCPNVVVEVTSALKSGDLFPVGSTTVVFRATDQGNNSATCSFTVVVSDTQKPAINCPPTVVRETGTFNCIAVIPNIGLATATDNCNVAGQPTSNASSTTYTAGTTLITWNVSDVNGNTNSCVQQIQVNDIQRPLLTCPGTTYATNDEFNCTARINYDAEVYDNCGTVDMDYTNAPNSEFEIGSTVVTVTATDDFGNSSTCEFFVIVSPRTEVCNGWDDDCDGYTDEYDSWDLALKAWTPGAGAANSDRFGHAVALDSSWAIVGRPQSSDGGHAYSYRKVGGQWSYAGELTPNQAPAAGEMFGYSVGISSTWAAAGAPGVDSAQGRVVIFSIDPQNPAAGWTQIAELTNGVDSSGYGKSISIRGNVLIVGAPDENGGTGALYIYNRNQGGANAWGLVKKVVADDGQPGDNFGSSVSTQGGMAAVGAPGQDEVGTNAGAAYLFNQNAGGAGNWGQVKKVVVTSSGVNDNFGAAVAVSAGRLVVGAPNNDKYGLDAGNAYVFERNQGGNGNWGWSALLNPFNDTKYSRFGTTVALDSNYALVGAPGDNPHGFASGSAFVFFRQNASFWTLTGMYDDPNGQRGDRFGSSVSISGQSFVAGVPSDGGVTTPESGSAMFFEAGCGTANRDAEQEVAVGEMSVRCFPVPFSESLNIEFELTTAGQARVSVFNVQGQEVEVLLDAAQEAGQQQLRWNAGAFPAGPYYVRVQSAAGVVVKAVVRM